MLKKDNVVYLKYAGALLLPALLAFLGFTLAISSYVKDQPQEKKDNKGIQKIKIAPDRPSIKKVTLKKIIPTESLKQALIKLNIKGDIPNLRVEIYKNKRELIIFSGDKLIFSYKINLGPSPAGKKLTKLDGKTPEGEYYVVDKNDSSFLPNQLGPGYIKINYPNNADAETALKSKRISKRTYQWIASFNNKKMLPPQNTTLGGGLGIHGSYGPNTDTKGCVGLNEKDLVEVFNILKVGTPVVIKP